MINNKKLHSGFSLAEVVVAIFIIAITSSAAFIITTMNIRAQVVGQDYAIAVNLAREGLEVTRAIRDSNWLYYSGSRRAGSGDSARDHWNDGFDGVDSFGNDYNANAVGVGFNLTDDRAYTINEMSNFFIPIIDYNNPDIYEKYKWKLKFITENLATNYPETDEFLIYKTSDVDEGLYIQDNTLLGTPPAGGKVTRYYRALDIRFQESYDQGGNCQPDAEATDGDNIADEDPPGDYNGDGNDDDDGDGATDEDGFHADCKLNANDNIILVRSIVSWLDYQGNRLHVTLETTLTDWFRREDHT